MEILSDSTQRRELTAKRTPFRENDPPHYLMIDPTEETVENVSVEGKRLVDPAQPLVIVLGSTGCQIAIECPPLLA